jgi:hypothetical protein
VHARSQAVSFSALLLLSRLKILIGELAFCVVLFLGATLSVSEDQYIAQHCKLLNPANQGGPFYVVKSDILKILAFQGAILKNLNRLVDLSLDLN